MIGVERHNTFLDSLHTVHVRSCLYIRSGGTWLDVRHTYDGGKEQGPRLAKCWALYDNAIWALTIGPWSMTRVRSITCDTWCCCHRATYAPRSCYFSRFWALRTFAVRRKCGVADLYPSWGHTPPVALAIEVLHAARRFEFRRNPQSHS